LDPSTTAAHFEILSRLARQSKCYRLYSGRNQQELEQAVDRLLAGSLNEHGEKDD
jgi:trehalose-6-phosphatase